MSGSDPRAAEAFDPARFMSYVSRFGHGGAIGITYRDHGPDWCELELPYSEKLIGMPESGIIASGPIISLMDMATSISIWVRLGRFRPQATLDAYGLRSGLWIDRRRGIGIAYFVTGLPAVTPPGKSSFTAAEEEAFRRAARLRR